MPPKTATRIKAKAQVYVPQTRDDTAADIRQIGDLERQKLRVISEMNDAIAQITQSYQPRIDALSDQLKTLQEGVQGYCEAHRDELTDNGKVKFANLITGEVSWRQRPPSVSVRGQEAVIDILKRLGLTSFIRTKEEVNKEAILNETDKARGVPGLTIVTGVEDFVITPFEQEVTG
ncbi:MAG: host-nuclease inhibitor Gam family protein [Nitrosomonas sp.]|nr:host-nuclease inhibitor Gam family protein [Nitrosomonas sp.]